MHSFVCVFVCVFVHVHVHGHRVNSICNEARGQLVGVVLFFHYMGPRDQTQVPRLAHAFIHLITSLALPSTHS